MVNLCSRWQKMFVFCLNCKQKQIMFNLLKLIRLQSNVLKCSKSLTALGLKSQKFHYGSKDKGHKLSIIQNENTRVPPMLLAGVLTYFGFKEKSEAEKESELITSIKRSILLIQKEEFKKAEQMLHIALKLAQEQKNSDGITYVYDVMANLAYDTGEWHKAEKLFVTVMQRLVSIGVEGNDNRMLHISLKLSRIYEVGGDKGKAEEGYKFCIDNLEHRVTVEGEMTEDTLLLWAMALDYYAHFLLSQNRLKEAFSCFQKAYNTCVKVHGEEHEQVVVLLNDLGTVSNMMGNWQQAITYFKRAVVTGEKIPEMRDLGSVYVNLGQMYLLKNMLEESKKACSAGKRTAVKYGDQETEEEADECLKEIQKAANI